MKKIKTSVLVFFAIVALLLTWFNGIDRALNNMTDFNILYAGTKLFNEGGNPYFSAPLQEILGPGVKNELGIQMTLPGVFGLMSPIGSIDHGLATKLWLALHLLSIAGSLMLLLILTELRLISFHGFLLVIFSLLLGPFRMGIRQGQLDNIVLFLVLLAVTVVWKSKIRLFPAIILSIGITLKPTSAGLFSIYLLLRGKVYSSIVSITLSGIFIALCAAILTVNIPEWWVTWREIAGSVESDFNKVTETNPSLSLLTHLQVGIFSATESRLWSSVYSYMICLSLLIRTLLSVTLDKNCDPLEKYLRELSIIAMVSLLIVYHRFYSGVFIVFPIAWAVYMVSNNKANFSIWVVLLTPLLMLINGQAAFTYVIEKELIGWLDGSSWFERVVLSFHYVWIQLFILVVLFVEQLRKTQLSIESIMKIK